MQVMSCALKSKIVVAVVVRLPYCRLANENITPSNKSKITVFFTETCVLIEDMEIVTLAFALM